MFKLAISFFAAFVAEAIYAQTVPVGGLCKSDFVIHPNVQTSYLNVFPKVLGLLALFL